MTRPGCATEPDMGDLVVVLLAGTLAGLRDRLLADGFDGAAELWPTWWRSRTTI
ncbi:MAG TPA: hypothetical protein VE975_08315 [Actinomycetota bacterium]|nr:hypothetical protein [Actinomycetota bacterium]